MAGQTMADQTVEQRRMERKHIFAVNGSSAFLNILRELLEEELYNITTTNFVPRTYDQIETLQPDLIIIDLVVGVQAGWELLERLQAEAVTRAIPVLITSTDPRLLERARVDAARYGVHPSLAKPLDLDELMGAIHDLIGEA